MLTTTKVHDIFSIQNFDENNPPYAVHVSGTVLQTGFGRASPRARPWQSGFFKFPYKTSQFRVVPAPKFLKGLVPARARGLGGLVPAATLIRNVTFFTGAVSAGISSF